MEQTVDRDEKELLTWIAKPIPLVRAAHRLLTEDMSNVPLIACKILAKRPSGKLHLLQERAWVRDNEGKGALG